MERRKVSFESVRVFGIIFSILVLPVRAHLGRPAAPPTATGWGEELRTAQCYIGLTGQGGATLTARDLASHIGRTGLLRVASQDVTTHMSAHAPPPEPIRARV